MIRLIAAALACLSLAACAGGPQPSDRLGAAPELKLEAFLDGRTYAYGVFERGGVLDRKFWVEVDGEWDGRTLTLDEHFLYDDGQTQRRIWEWRRAADGGFAGVAGDVIGTADIDLYGDSAFFTYDVDLELSDGDTIRVRLDDRIYAAGDEVLINRSTVKKFGLAVGQVTVVFLKNRPSDWPDVPRAD